MHLSLVVSGLLDFPGSVLASADAGAPVLARLLALAKPPTIDRDGGVAIACVALGIARQRDWPVAPWLARAASSDAGAGYWLCADPATFLVGRDEVRLSGPVRDLAEHETAVLLATLNKHFAGDGVRFVALEASRWLVGIDAAQALATHTPDEALGAELLALLPTGADAPRWRRWQDEIQMLFFEHPVNLARESAGRALVNGVWLWGGGTPVVVDAGTRVAALYADAWLPRELARAVGVTSASVPVSFDALRASSWASPALVWFDAPDGDEAQRLAEWLAAFDRDWAGPAADAFNVREIRELDFIVTGRSLALRYRARHASLMQRVHAWRSNPSLSALLAAHLEA